MVIILTGGPRGVRHLWFAADGSAAHAANGDGVARRWRLDAPTAPTGLRRHGFDVALAEQPTDDRVRLMTTFGGGRIRYDYASERWTVPVTSDSYPQALAVLADGDRFVAAERASAGDGRGNVPAWLGVRSLADGRELAVLPFRYASQVVLAAVPDSARVVGTAGGRLLVWDCDAGTCEEVPGRGRKLWQDLAAHPTGRAVAAVNNTPAVTFVDPHAAAVAGTFDPGVGPLTAVAVSPDGLLWAAAGAKGQVAVWDAEGGPC